MFEAGFHELQWYEKEHVKEMHQNLWTERGGFSESLTQFKRHMLANHGCDWHHATILGLEFPKG